MTTSLFRNLALGSALAIVGAASLAMPAAAQSASNSTCRPGYTILIDNQCIDYNTGYIELAHVVQVGPSTATVASCPSGYESLIENQCIDYKTGYIVSARATSIPRYTSANCRQGYSILIENQCIDYTTGYIELASENPSATRTARK